MLRRWVQTSAVLCALAASSLAATAVAAPPADVANRTLELIERLYSDSFSVREEARRQLLALARDDAAKLEVRRIVESRLTDKRSTLDVREALRSILSVEPPTAAVSSPDSVEPPHPPAEAELDGLLDALAAPSFAARDQAERQLIVAAESPATCGALLRRLQERAEDTATTDLTQRWHSVWQAAWPTWLAGGPDVWTPPAPDAGQLAATIESLTKVAPADEIPPWARPQARAERQLLLWLACDESTTAVAAALRRRLDGDRLHPDAAARLDAVLAWTRPAMAAEFWLDGKHQSVQHLVLGVPNQPLGAPRPSLFDRCDDETAHCVSGNSLAPGDHSVGIFFPHPSEIQTNALFHLVNLPTPRRRLAYEFAFPIARKSDEELDRLSDRRRGPITRKTVDYLLKQQRLLTPREIDMFQFLDPTEASRFAEPYLTRIADERYDSGSPQPFGNGSLHGWFCYMMTNVGTAEAGRSVAAAIDKRRILGPTETKPYRMDWISALTLARQAPWDGLDEWLAAQLERTEPLKIDDAHAADVGASAAALLLERQGVEPSAYGLRRHEFPDLIDLGNPGYRFAKPEDREAVKRWWDERRKSS
jgi:hypothetical protein